MNTSIRSDSLQEYVVQFHYTDGRSVADGTMDNWIRKFRKLDPNVIAETCYYRVGENKVINIKTNIFRADLLEMCFKFISYYDKLLVEPVSKSENLIMKATSVEHMHLTVDQLIEHQLLGLNKIVETSNADFESWYSVALSYFEDKGITPTDDQVIAYIQDYLLPDNVSKDEIKNWLIKYRTYHKESVDVGKLFQGVQVKIIRGSYKDQTGVISRVDFNDDGSVRGNQVDIKLSDGKMIYPGVEDIEIVDKYFNRESVDDILKLGEGDIVYYRGKKCTVVEVRDSGYEYSLIHLDDTDNETGDQFSVKKSDPYLFLKKESVDNVSTLFTEDDNQLAADIDIITTFAKRHPDLIFKCLSNSSYSTVEDLIGKGSASDIGKVAQSCTLNDPSNPNHIHQSSLKTEGITIRMSCDVSSEIPRLQSILEEPPYNCKCSIDGNELVVDCGDNDPHDIAQVSSMVTGDWHVTDDGTQESLSVDAQIDIYLNSRQFKT